MTESLDRDPVVLLYDVARIMRTKFDQRARARGMTRAQWHILARVERQPGLSQSELAAICEVEPITVARLVDRLEKRGLLERRAGSARSAHLALAQPSAGAADSRRDQRVPSRTHSATSTRTSAPAAREAMVDALLGVRAQMTAVDPLNDRVSAVTRKRPSQAAGR